MAAGKSCSAQHPDGVRRTVGGHTLAPRSQRKTETIVDNVMRWDPFHKTRMLQPVEKKISKVFLD